MTPTEAAKTVHVVGFSGGIDSQACARWVLNRYDPSTVVMLNSDAGGNEHPITTQHVEWYSKNVHPVIVVSAQIQDLAGRATINKEQAARRAEYQESDPMTFGDLAYIKGFFPVGRQQFCTDHLKLYPQKRWLQEHYPEGNYIRYSGKRRDESKRRACTPFEEWDDFFQTDLICPIADWSKQMCFDYCKAHGEQINPLYEMGFGRVGCAPCVNSTKEDILNWATRFPEMIDKVRAWEKQAGRPFFRPDDSTSEVLFIDDVVKWSKTVRGGKQIALPYYQAEAQLGQCVSKYSLCE